MVEATLLSRILREGMKSGKYAIGSKECLAALRGSKVVICSRTMPDDLGSRLKDEAMKHKVAVVNSEMTSAELAKMIGRPFRVSAVALRSVSEADLKQLTR